MIDHMVWANYAYLNFHLTKYMICVSDHSKQPSCFFLICATLHPHGVWYMHIHFHRCFIFGWEIVIIQFSLLNYGLPLIYLVKRLPYRVSVSIQLHVASLFKNAAYPSMNFWFPWWFCWWGMGKCRWDSSYLGLPQGESQGGANGWKQRRTHCSE